MSTKCISWSVICNHISYPWWSMPIVSDAFGMIRYAISVLDSLSRSKACNFSEGLAWKRGQTWARSKSGTLGFAAVCRRKCAWQNQPRLGSAHEWLGLRSIFRVAAALCVLGPWWAECIYRCVMDLGTCTGVQDVESDVVVRLILGDNSESI